MHEVLRAISYRTALATHQGDISCVVSLLLNFILYFLNMPLIVLLSLIIKTQDSKKGALQLF